MNTSYQIDEKKVKLETISCNVCRGDNFDPIVSSSGIRQHCSKVYTIVKCRTCGLCYLNPRPTRDSIVRYYQEDDTEKIRRKPSLAERFYVRFFRRVPLGRAGSLLDIGCGCGRYIYILKEKGWDVKGIDIAYTDYGRDVLGLNIHEGTLFDAKLPSESFDAVTLWWTLEHMYEPIEILKEAERILKKGGVLLVGVPNIDSFESRIFKKYWFHLFLPKHTYHFSPVSLTNALNIAGFKDVKIRHDLFSFGTIGSLQCLLNDHGINISLNNSFFYAISLPLDIVLGIMRQSGLITAYAFK